MVQGKCNSFLMKLDMHMEIFEGQISGLFVHKIDHLTYCGFKYSQTRL